MGDKRKIYLSLDAPYRIKYEGISDFEDSLFSSVYRQAAEITREIIEKNEEYHSNPRRKGNEYRNNEQIYNVISFVGERGSGKTSCMLSFAEYLKDYHRISDTAGARDYFIGRDTAFIGIDSIDAGLLENKEDIVEVVLAKLLSQFQKKDDKGNSVRDSDYDYMRREFNRCLQRVYTSNVRRKDEKSIDEFASVNTLNEMAVSVNMRESIKELISKYIGLMRSRYFPENVPDTKCFVVIPIDDIDMNIAKGYEMLEQIRRYFMVPNVIVLLSYRYDQLRDICKLYYLRAFDGLQKILTEQSFHKRLSYLSNCYMAKVVPDGRRISLYTIDDVECLTEEQVYVIPANSDIGKEDAHCVEETFLRKVGRCFDIRSWYFGRGMELWKCANLRDMCNLYNELHVLKDPCTLQEQRSRYRQDRENQEREQQEIQRYYEDNFRWLVNYIRHKAGTELEEEENRKLTEIMRQPLAKLNTVLFEMYDEMRINMFDDYDFMYNAEEVSREAEICRKEKSLGTSLYLLNRIEDWGEDHGFARFVRPYLSSVIGNLYLSTDNSISKIKKIMGEGMGYYDRNLLPKFDYKLDPNEDKALVVPAGYIYGIKDGISSSIRISSGKTIGKNIKKLETMFMFLNHTENISVRYSNAGIGIKIEKCDFRVSNFIWNIFTYKEHLQMLKSELEKSLRKKFTAEKEGKVREILELYQADSLLKDMEEWEARYGTAQILPFHNVEFLAYLLDECSTMFDNSKLVLTSAETEGKQRIREEKEVNKYMIQLFDRIKKILGEQDEFYERAKRTGDGAVRSLKEIFENCPVIQNVYNNELSIRPGYWAGISDSIRDIAEDI